MITIISQGDHNYQEEFKTEKEAYKFLQKVLDNTNNGRWDETDEVFDQEGDLITWIEGNKKKYCAGWHWMSEQDKEQIIMPNGKTFYEQIC